MNEPLQFQAGQRVRKVGGEYMLEGVIVAAFHTRKGKARYVLDADNPPGLLHIYSAHNLEMI